MSLSRQIKTLFTLSTLIFTYIIWATVSIVILNNAVTYIVYIISFSSVFLMQYLMKKQINYKLQLLIPFFIEVVVNALVFSTYSIICNSLYIFFVLISFKKLENEEVIYEEYKNRVKVFIYILIVLGTILPLLNKELEQNVSIFYIIYIMSAIIVLRDARKFSNKISNKKSLLIDLVIVFCAIFISMDKINNFLSRVFSSLSLSIDLILHKITIGITYVIIRPSIYAINFIFYIFHNKKMDVKQYGGILGPDYTKDYIEPSKGKLLLYLIVKIIIVLLILYLIFKVFNHYINRNSKDGETQKENIFRERKRNKHINLSKFMKLLKKGGDVRVQILNIYLIFEQKMMEKEIYKTHMTAGQLSIVAKTKINEAEAINSITSIYNEAKFSNHEIPEKNVKIAKSNYKSVIKKV